MLSMPVQERTAGPRLHADQLLAAWAIEGRLPAHQALGRTGEVDQQRVLRAAGWHRHVVAAVDVSAEEVPRTVLVDADVRIQTHRPAPAGGQILQQLAQASCPERSGEGRVVEGHALVVPKGLAKCRAPARLQLQARRVHGLDDGAALGIVQDTVDVDGAGHILLLQRELLGCGQASAWEAQPRLRFLAAPAVLREHAAAPASSGGGGSERASKFAEGGDADQARHSMRCFT
mmetsp:Transcript_18155/g.47924  ORF Transcript_18155/g.47924 Transcript_18155/m.47924 type:complete len:232 (+) Transcript_18155:486-1181(+)